MRSASSGASDANSRASTTSTGLGTRCLPVGRYPGLAFDDDLPEELRLLRLDAALAHELQHREQRHHDVRALALAARERGEQERPRVAQHRQDLGHALEHGGRVRLDVTRAVAALLLDELADRARQPVHAEVLERQGLHARQGGAGTAPAEGHLRPARAEPRAPRPPTPGPPLATALARRLPSCRISTIRFGFSANCWRRSRIFSSGGIMCLRSTSLQSRHPMAAVRQPVAQYSRSAGGVKILCRSNTGHTSGLPGSERRLRAGSVIMGRTLARIVSGGSASSMSLPYDLDILRPSVPGTLGISVSLTSGSGKTSPNALLNRRATSRVSSTCGAWSIPTGTHFGLYMRMSADCSSG